jgi:signal transduction histidine kinase
VSKRWSGMTSKKPSGSSCRWRLSCSPVLPSPVGRSSPHWRRWALAQAQQQALQEINRRIEAFLGIAAHELKTPLTSVMLGLQRQYRRLHRPASQATDATGWEQQRVATRKDVELSLQQAERLNRLVSELLDTSRIQAGQLRLELKLADLGNIVQSAVEEQRHAVPERTIVLHLPEGPMPVCGDADRLGQVVTNYLTNALKYSPEDRPVEVGGQIEGQQLRVWVRDQGPGIPLSEQEPIWERFHRVPAIEVQSGSGIGLGLGLSISKAFIASHKGQVGVQSTPGHGATFWFTLPLAVKQPGSG